MSEQQRKKPANITREELYRQVWATPMSRLSTQYGISGNGLKKICVRLNVPYPPRGYWAKLAAGKRVKRTPLPRAQVGTSTEVTITPTPSRGPCAGTRTRSGDRQSAKRGMHRGLGNTVPAILRRPHWAIAAWINRHERDLAAAKRDRLLWGREFGPKTHSSLVASLTSSRGTATTPIPNFEGALPQNGSHGRKIVSMHSIPLVGALARSGRIWRLLQRGTTCPRWRRRS
jgi:hypothetical protein